MMGPLCRGTGTILKVWYNRTGWSVNIRCVHLANFAYPLPVLVKDEKSVRQFQSTQAVVCYLHAIFLKMSMSIYLD